jgi:tetratricopeptide (TPR) repeat protein
MINRNWCRFVLFLLGVLIPGVVYAQDAEAYADKGREAAKARDFVQAIALLDTAVSLEPNDAAAWYLRALLKGGIRRYEDAVADLDQCIRLKADFKKAYNLRGRFRQYVTDYEGALHDFNVAIVLDRAYIDALYNRGALQELLGKRTEACKDFNTAAALGDEQSKRKAEACKEAPVPNIHAILYLVRTADSKKYGFSEKHPVLVGRGPDGGPANQHAYLDLLRDSRGNPVSYERVGHCCAYKSENGFMGTALLDKYEVSYINERGKPVKTLLYLSMYDYEAPQIPVGFATVSKK